MALRLVCYWACLNRESGVDPAAWAVNTNMYKRCLYGFILRFFISSPNISYNMFHAIKKKSNLIFWFALWSNLKLSTPSFLRSRVGLSSEMALFWFHFCLKIQQVCQTQLSWLFNISCHHVKIFAKVLVYKDFYQCRLTWDEWVFVFLNFVQALTPQRWDLQCSSPKWILSYCAYFYLSLSIF